MGGVALLMELPYERVLCSSVKNNDEQPTLIEWGAKGLNPLQFSKQKGASNSENVQENK